MIGFCQYPILRRHRIPIDPVDHLPDSHPNRKVSKDIRQASLICKRRLLQNRQIFHHPVFHNILHNLIHKINLSSIQIRAVQILRKRVLRRPHIQSHDPADKLSQWLLANLLFIIRLCPNLLPQNSLQQLHILSGQRLIPSQFCDNPMILSWCCLI